MRFLQTWTFVNCGAVIAFAASVLLIELPAKMSAEPSLRNYVLHAILAGLAWLVLAVVRFLYNQSETRQ